MAAIGLRAWTLDARDYGGDEAAFRQAVVEELAASEYLGYRLGIAVVSAPIRVQQVEGGDWATIGWRFQTTTVPGVRLADLDNLDTAAADVGDAAEAVLDDEPDDEPASEPEPADVAY